MTRLRLFDAALVLAEELSDFYMSGLGFQRVGSRILGARDASEIGGVAGRRRALCWESQATFWRLRLGCFFRGASFPGALFLLCGAVLNSLATGLGEIGTSTDSSNNIAIPASGDATPSSGSCSGELLERIVPSHGVPT